MKKFIMAIVCLMTIVVSFMSCGSDLKNDESSEYYEEAKAKAEALKDSLIESALPIKCWEVDSEVDEMTDTKRYFARLISNNEIVQDFPYGETRASIVIRNTKKYGNDALITVSSGQIHGSEYEGSNYIEVRFDDKPSKKYTYTETESGASDVVFIDKSKDFIENCKKAKSIKVKIPMFQEGRLLFTFHSDKLLVWNH